MKYKRQMTSKRIILPAIISALFYLLIISYLMNFSLVRDAVFGNHELSYTLKILYFTVIGMLNSMSALNVLIIFVTAILLGLNLALLIDRMKLLRKLGKLHVVVGGTSILGIASSGCGSCSLSVVSIFGVAGGISFLPLRGLEISFLVVSILILSLYLQFRTYSEELRCLIKK